MKMIVTVRQTVDSQDLAKFIHEIDNNPTAQLISIEPVPSVRPTWDSYTSR